MQTKNLPYTLGLDIGMASVGAALLLPDQERILALHVRTFDKAETAKEGESLNKIRRDSRLTRRRIRRRAHRLVRLARLMKRVGLIADANPEAFALPGVSPWHLRADGLDRLLEPKEWAGVLYHLVKHRGFQSNRKSEAKADEKAGQMLSGVGRNQALLKEAGYRTVGELAARHEDFKEAKRNKGGSYSHTFARADLNAELNLLFERQRALGSRLASADFQENVRDLLMARRPTLSGANLLKMVGKCTFEKSEDRAPKAGYRAERFVWLGKLNNLKIVGSGDARPLTDAEHRIVIDLPFTQAKLTFKQVRKALELETHQRFNLLSYRPDPKGKDKDPEESTFFEAKSFHTLRKAYEGAGLKKEWQRDALDPDRLDALAYALTCYKDDTESRQWLVAQGIGTPIIEAVLAESFDKFIHLSQKALKAILPHMEAGQRYDDAAKSAGYDHSQPDAGTGKRATLPPPDKDTIRNPVVYRALNQARKLVNAIVAEYGPPAAVHIELARDLSKPIDERRDIEKGQKEFQALKEKLAAAFEETFHRKPSGLDLLKYRLFREQLDQCPYCQKALVVDRLFEPGYAQIDHALPYSRSFDDGMNNKVVVHVACNQDKGNRTPYEFLDGAGDSERWQRFVAWVQGNKAIRQAKRNRLLRVNFGTDEAKEFSKRNLSDTRYICREFKRTIETQFAWHSDAEGNERCVVLSGQLTSLLRARWGLIKVREDGDLHHALDVAVIAAASRSLVKRMADYSRRNELEMVRNRYVDPATGEVVDVAALRQIEDHFPKPWPLFREELLARLAPEPKLQLTCVSSYDEGLRESIRPIRVSRAPTRRGLGAAHQETIRSLRDGSQSAIKTPLRDLNLKDLENIVGFERDTALIDAIRTRLEAFGGEGKKAFDDKQPPLRKPSKDPDKAPIIRSVKLLVTQKSGIPIRGGIANNGAMLRSDIFTKAGKFYAVPIYVADAVRGELPHRAVAQAKPELEWPMMDESYQFLFSLHPNDWMTIRLKNEVREGYYAGLDRATGNISLWLHDRNQNVGQKGLLTGNGIKTALAVEKYHVDLLGKLHRVHKEERQPIHIKPGKR
ncbi:MAG: type II CRISPR RNA-guided endonuclease Cas9 [Rhodocyclales bacterium GWA2_65_19]|nr:CRISPR-associated protein Cas9 [uncultured bacterium]OHC61148.1 MAG: type II CRISPR RNA-guided endonuclease Cas9 [Rhodocyclales bacterium GWA2_65_19]